MPELEAHVLDHPLREGLWAQLMYALYQTGRQPEALRAYQRACDAFADTGTAPSDDLRNLEEMILLRDPTLSEGWPTTPAGPVGEAPLVLPSERTSFVGRDEELRLASQLLSDARLVTLRGPPGVGKTRFACRLAAEQFGKYRHGVFFVPLAAVDAAPLVEPAIARVLGVRGGRELSTPESLAAYLRERSRKTRNGSTSRGAPPSTRPTSMFRRPPIPRTDGTSRTVIRPA